MNEKLLQLIWEYSLHTLRHLTTTHQEPINIVEVGTKNIHQGPDFVDAKIRFQNVIWSGNIEIDLTTSKWIEHKHQHNKDYQNIIAHVVWEDDMDEPPHPFPIIAMKHQVSLFFLKSYASYLEGKTNTIPCGTMMDKVDGETWTRYKDQLVKERFDEKIKEFLFVQSQQQGDWEQSFWVWLARYMGGLQNGLAFEHLAKCLPITVIYKEKNDIKHIEALLFGTAGLLHSVHQDDAYALQLQEIFSHLSHKYQLKPSPFKLHYLRMRPYQFPDLRLAQLSALLFSIDRITHLISHSSVWKDVLEKADKQMDEYWSHHFRLGKATHKIHSHQIGDAFKNTLLINVFVVAHLAYLSTEHHPTSLLFTMLEALPKEKNHATLFFENISVQKMKTAKDSQAFLHLLKNYCHKKRCLECHIGKYLLTS